MERKLRQLRPPGYLTTFQSQRVILRPCMGSSTSVWSGYSNNRALDFRNLQAQILNACSNT